MRRPRWRRQRRSSRACGRDRPGARDGRLGILPGAGVHRLGRAPGRGRGQLAPDPERRRRRERGAGHREGRPSPPTGPAWRSSGNTAWNAAKSNDYDLLNQRAESRAPLEPVRPLRPGARRLRARGHRWTSRMPQATDARREVAAELTARLADLDAARAQIDITGTSVVAAREDLRVQQERYRLGASTIVDRAHLAGSAQPGGGGCADRQIQLSPRQGADRSADRTKPVTGTLGDTAERMAMLPAGCPARRRHRHPESPARLRHGRRDRARPARRGRQHPAQRVRRHHGPVGLGQIHAHESDRLPRQPHRRRVLAQRAPGLRAGRRPARADPEQGDRVRVPDLQPAAPRDGAAQRRAAAGLRGHGVEGAAGARRATRSRGSASGSG